MKTTNITISDLPKFYQIQPEGWNDITPHFQFYLNKDYCYPIKYMNDDEIAGVGCTIVHNNVAWLGHIIVGEKFRNQGIGKIITQDLIKQAKDLGCDTIQLVATNLGYPVYLKQGFIIQCNYLSFGKTKQNPKWTVSPNVRPFDPNYTNEILALDRFISGENRKEMIQEFLNDGLYYMSDNTIKGYYLPSLGEGLIIGSDSESGLALLKIHIQSTDKVILPSENKTAIDFLKKLGFEQKDNGYRMILGKGIDVKLDCVYNRIAGNVG